METFNVLEFLNYYKSKILYVIIAVIVGIAISVVYTFWIQVPVYKSSTSLVLAQSESNNTTITQSDITLNKNLLSTYREIIKSRKILLKVISELDLDISYGELASQVSVSSVNDTELIVISVQNENNKLARDIANEIAKVFEDEIVEIYNIENVSIIDKAIVSKVPANVNEVKQIAIGFLLGLFLSSMVIVVLFYFDDTVKSEEDIEKKLGLPVLGLVPKYNNKRGKKYGKWVNYL